MAGEAKIFISYSRRNKAFTQKLFDALREDGYDPWVDFDDIPFSVDWWQEIKDAIDEHDVIIHVVSNDSLVSRVCNEEILYAREHNKRIIPLIVEDVDMRYVVGELYDQPYEMTARANWKYVRTLNWIYFYRDGDDFNMGVENIMHAIETDHLHLRYHTRILTRALEWQQYDQGSGFLLRGEELTDAEEWLAGSEHKSPGPTELHRTYISTSRDIQEEEEARVRQMQQQTQVLRRASLGLILTAVVVVGGILAVLLRTLDAREDAELARAAAENQAITAEAGATQVAGNAATVEAEADNVATNAAAFRSTSTVVFSQQREIIDESNALRLAVEAQSELDGGDNSLLARPLGIAAYEAINNGNLPPRVQRIVSEGLYRPGLVRLFTTDPQAIGTCAAPGLASPAEDDLRGSAHRREVSEVLFGVDDTRIISAGQDQCVYVWDATNGSLLASLDGFSGRITSMALSPDGATIAVGESNGRITLWTLSGEQVGTLVDGGHNQRVTGLAFSYDGRYLGSVGFDARILLWDLSQERSIRRRDTFRRMTTISAHPNQLSFITGDIEGRLVLLQLDTNNDNELDNTAGNVITLDDVHTSQVTAIRYDPDGLYLVSTAMDGTAAYITDVERGVVNRIRQFEGFTIADMGVLQSRYAVFGLVSGRVVLLDLEQPETGFNQEVLVPTEGRSIRHLSVSRGRMLAVAGFDDGAVMLLDLNDGAVLQRRTPYTLIVEESYVRPDGLVLARERDGRVVLWEPGGDLLNRNILAGVDLDTNSLVLVPSGEVAIGYVPEGDLKRIDLSTMEQTVYAAEDGFINNRSPESRPITGLTVFSGDGTRALSVFTDAEQGMDSPLTASPSNANFQKSRILWDVVTGEVIADDIDIGAAVGGDFSTIALNYDGTRLAVFRGEADGGRLYLYDVETMTPLNSPENRSREITTIHYGTAGRPDLLLLGYADGAIGVVSDDGTQWLDLRGHASFVSDMDMGMYNGRLYGASVASDQSVLVWDLDAGEAIRQFRLRTRGDSLANFGLAGRTLITASLDNTAIVWRLDTPEELLTWVRSNRYVQPLSQNDCNTFQIPKPCGEGGT